MARLSPVRVLANTVAAACTRQAADTTPRHAVAGDVPPESYYEVGGAVPDPLHRAPGQGARKCRVERILLPPRVPTGLRDVPGSEDPIEILHYAPDGSDPSPRPLVVMSPILGNTNFLVDRFAASFARGGLHAAIVQRKALTFDPRATLQVAEDEVRLLVMRSRQAIDWLVRRPSVDAERVGTFGASAGGIVSSMLAGADRRLRAHVWLLAGGPLSDVMAHTVEGEYRDYRARALRVTGRRLPELRDSLRETFRTDPLLLAARVPREQVLLVLARFDRSVPYRYGLALWRSLGRPERVLVPAGHYTTFLLLPWLQHIALDHLRRKLGSGS